MIPGIPSPWLILAAVLGFLGAAAGGFFYGEHIDSLSWKAKVAAQEAQAATLLDQLDKTAAAKDAAQAAASRDMEAQHANQIQAVSSTADAFRTQLISVLNAQRGKGGTGSVSITPTQAGKPESASTGSDNGRGQVDPKSVQRVRDALRRLQEDVKFCWGYTGSITR